MPYLKTILFLIFCPFLLNGQNIITNPSFEDTVQLNFGLTFPKEWNSPNDGMAEHYNPNTIPLWSVPQSYSGYQYANKGNSYIGFIIYSLFNNNIKRRREYIQVKLNQILELDSTYCMQLFVSLADSMKYASRNQLGVYFSNLKISSNSRYELPFNPQIIVSPNEYITNKEKWKKFNFEYTAKGGERYLTMGNFNDTTSIDTLLVGGGNSQADFTGTYYYIDDVYLGHCDSVPLDTPNGLGENSLNNKINVYPNPAKEQLFISYQGNEKLQIQLYNLVGQSVEINERSLSEVEMQLSVGHLPKGVYLLQIIAGEEQISRKIIIK